MLGFGKSDHIWLLGLYTNDVDFKLYSNNYIDYVSCDYSYVINPQTNNLKGMVLLDLYNTVVLILCHYAVYEELLYEFVCIDSISMQECSKAMEFYKASLWVIGQKSNAIPQKTKLTKEPYLHEQILTMEIKHELQLPASEKAEK